jgi:hypothetical protein
MRSVYYKIYETPAQPLVTVKLIVKFSMIIVMYM